MVDGRESYDVELLVIKRCIMNMDKRILITGGAGFIASHVAVHLATKFPNYKVCIMFCCDPRGLLTCKILFYFFYARADRYPR